MLGSNQPNGECQLSALEGGRNNRVYRIDGLAEPVLVKSYFANPKDRRDRFTAERAFYTFLDTNGSRHAPRSLAWDSDRRLGLFTFVVGRKLEANEIDRSAIDAALDFFAETNRDRESAAAARLGDASEACFSIQAHLDLVERRVERIGQIEIADEVAAEASSFVQKKLAPLWKSVRDTAASEFERAGIPFQRELAAAERCISPSDFGFHNAIRRADGTLIFFDFEYGGWDDPAKLTCDFFCQQQKPVSTRFWDQVVSRIWKELGSPPEYGMRALTLYPAYQIKWCCIILNEFLASESARRLFAERSPPSADTRARQLAAAERLLDTVGRVAP